MTMNQPTPLPINPDLDRPIHLGIVSISDRASSGVYQDLGVPALEAWLKKPS